MRELFLALGQCMASDEALTDAEDVFFLTKVELEDCVLGPAEEVDLSGLASERWREFARLHRSYDAAPAWSYPPFLRGNWPLQAEAPGQDQWRGRAVSPGLAQGRVVVLFSPREFDKVQAGDVLVTHSVDPGWTPIFGLLSALVTEHGGQLSHSAVVAREYGLPAVAGISGVAQLLRDGDMVVVDGLSGTVARVGDPA
jgi:pyruvate,water dikinase